MHIFGEEEVLSIPFHVVVFMLTGCPMLAFVLCLSTSIFLHYEMAVSTHCGVPNWLPSLSAVVAYAPERYIWRFLLGISCTPRLAMAFAFRNYLISSSLWPLPLLSRFRWACHLACALNASYRDCVTYSSCNDFFVLHMLMFNAFVICGTLHMVIVTWLFDLSGRRRSSKIGEISFQTKAFCCIGQIISLFFALYFFYRHNRYCEPGMYTLFALAEYSLILFNGLFHTTIYYEFQSRVLSLVTAALKANYYLLPSHDYSEKRGT
uniref:CWH43-like N-terminal domain-containing protein n=1 Tax=Meloidogyne enterolobii TaxID=390850 RepID=A0A6V7TVG4_MELEN|nr:unnamed protein product [Meloidogyne enterolobii]